MKDLSLELSLTKGFYESTDTDDPRVGVHRHNLSPIWDISDEPDTVYLTFSNKPSKESYPFFWNGPGSLCLEDSKGIAFPLSVPFALFYYMRNKWDYSQVHISLLTKEFYS